MSQVILENIEVKKILYRHDPSSFFVFSAEVQREKENHNGKKVKVKSTETMSGYFFSIAVGDQMTVLGEYVKHKVYGNQFLISGYKKETPQSILGIETFLKRHIKGLGETKVKAITAEFGESTLSKIAEDRANLDKIPGISEKKKDEIFEKISDSLSFEELLSFLLGNSIEYSLAIKIFDAFGKDSIYTLKTNPYSLFKLGVVSFSACEKMASSLGFSKDCEERIEAGVLGVLKKNSSALGNIYLKEEFLKRDTLYFLNKSEAFPKLEDIPNLQVALDKLSDISSSTNLIIIEDKKVYLKELYIAEKTIAKQVKTRLSEGRYENHSDEKFEKAISKFEKEKGIVLDQDQKVAVKTSLQNPISIITGGPGTGKTQTMAALISCIRHFTPDAEIHLCSPTGKAAKRMSEVSGDDATTIHRLIKMFDETAFASQEIVGGDYVIIDESSLIDSKLFASLLQNIYSKTNIVIIGDHMQIPSVGPGKVLKDLINSGAIPTTELKKVFRQAEGSSIVSNAHKIREDRPFSDLTFSRGNKGDFYFLKCDDEKISETITICLKKLLSIKNLSLEDIQILAPTKTSNVGTNALNQLIQAEFGNHNLYFEYEDKLFCLGDKVIHTENNYDLNVFNGETGIVSKIDVVNGEITVKFPEKEVSYTKDLLPQLDLSYAITIHKAQGSEFKIIVIPVSRAYKKPLNKGLLYTGITRAKSMVLFVGDPETFKERLSCTSSLNRNSLLENLFSA